MLKKNIAALVLVFLCAARQENTVEKGLVDFQQGRFSEAFQAWSHAADAGDARGALYIGVLYDSGLGVAQNYRQAMTWYRRAAQLGDAAGSFNVGVMYDAGLGVTKNPGQAAAWYGRAAGQGSARADYNLAMLYETGTGVAKNRARAVALYQRAAAHGIAAARMHLAELHQSAPAAMPEPPDDSMARFRQAQQLLVSRGAADSSRMVTLFQRAADQHNALAEYDLGYCYETGMGAPRDQAKALSWYTRAAADAQDDSLRALAQSGAANLRHATP